MIMVTMDALLAENATHTRLAGETNLPQPNASAVSWGAIFAGAAAAAALSLILLILGTGLGLSSVSPWANSGVGVTALGVSTIVWLTVTQLLASGMGGYLAGRLRTKWAGAHTDEVYFRDTAHGFLAWAVASLVTAALLTSVIGSIVGAGVQAGASVASGIGSTALVATAGGAAAAGSEAAKSDSASGPMGYFVDSLFRKDAAAQATSPSVAPAGGQQPVGAPTSEVTRIFASTLQSGALSREDTQYVGQLIAQRTGMTQQDAEKRVTEVYTRLQTKVRDTETAAKEAADKARKASAYTALWLFISLLIGAFIASFSATMGGRRRDA
jgi:hypothetical protein